MTSRQHGQGRKKRIERRRRIEKRRKRMPGTAETPIPAQPEGWRRSIPNSVQTPLDVQIERDVCRLPPFRQHHAGGMMSGAAFMRSLTGRAGFAVCRV